ncbi:hypothetical protein [Metabacillus sp. Hm71]|uniref:hypothetical protein n=1 Tax=Metabacillus sp. Hm71 TaxID=3450743 RepID=UPI003F43FA83
MSLNCTGNEGCLEVTIVHSISRFELVMYALAGRKKLIHTFSCELLNIASSDPISIHDGEMAGELPVTVKSRKSPVALITKYYF